MSPVRPDSPRRMRAVLLAAAGVLAIGFLLFPRFKTANGTGATPVAPGSMRVLEQTPIAQGVRNLVRNGGLQAWWPGSPVPQAFIGPRPEFSVTVPTATHGGALAVEQRWTALDNQEPLASLLRCEVAGLRAGTTYEVSVLAEGSAGAQAAVGLWFAPENGNATALDPDFLQIQGDGIGARWYAKRFVAAGAGTLTLAGHAMPGTPSDCWVRWCYWQVRETKGEKP